MGFGLGSNKWFLEAITAEIPFIEMSLTAHVERLSVSLFKTFYWFRYDVPVCFSMKPMRFIQSKLTRCVINFFLFLSVDVTELRNRS